MTAFHVFFDLHSDLALMVLPASEPLQNEDDKIGFFI